MVHYDVCQIKYSSAIDTLQYIFLQVLLFSLLFYICFMPTYRRWQCDYSLWYM